MKNIFLCCIFIFTVSCSPLDTVPTDFSSVEYYYNTEEDLTYALNGVYDIVGRNLYHHDGLFGGFDIADEFYMTRTSGPHAYNYDASNANVLSLWQTLYRGIERSNLLLANIDKAAIPDGKRKIIKGEAQFLRAYFHFLLVQNFGDIPLKTAPTPSVSDVYIARTPRKEVYDFIYSEMVEAESLVRPISDVHYAGRVTQSAAQGILARVSLFRAGYPFDDPGKYRDALEWAEKVIHSGLHKLNPSYSQVFINMIQDKYDLSESIWEVEYFTTGITDVSETGAVGINNGIPQELLEYGYATGGSYIQEKLYRLFEQEDTRRDWVAAPYYFERNSNPPRKINWAESQIYERFIGKFRREYELVADKSKNTNGCNFPLLRYSDVLLMAAEAENEINGPTEKAFGYLNQVRLRAGVSPLEYGQVNIDQSSLREFIIDERSRELCFEALRRNDLIRWGIFIPRMKELLAFVNQSNTTASLKTSAGRAADNVSEMHLLIPIPLRELSINKLLTQNSGW